MAPRQLDLFHQPTIGGVVRDIKLAMNKAVKDSGLSRVQVLDLLNEFADRHRVKLNGGRAKCLSEDVLEKWLNPHDEARIPSLRALTAFCAVIGTCEPITVMARILGFMVIEGDDVQLLKWAKLQKKMKAVRAEVRKIEADW